MEKNNNLTVVVLLIIVFVIGFLGGSLWTENRLLKSGSANIAVKEADNEEKAAETALKNIPEVTDQDHIRGNKDAKVVLIEYSDYQCPYCNKFHPTMKEVMDNYGDQVAWVYRHFPLSFHPYAQILGEASECVASYAGNDEFWNFSDDVYASMADKSIYEEDGETISDETILSKAVSAGANRADIEKCLDSSEMTNRVKNQAAAAGQAGITGTPGTVIVSEKGGYELIPGALPYVQVEQMLQNHL